MSTDAERDAETMKGRFVHDDISEILLDESTIANRVRELAKELAEHLADSLASDEPIVLVPIMTGSLVFTADLIRHLPNKMRIGVVTVSSYSGATTERRETALQSALPQNLEGRHVVIVDDIFDTGHTMALLDREARTAGASGVTSVVLLSKPARHEVEIRPDFSGFEIPDAFVVGYGLDYDGHYRNLPCIGILRPEAIR